MFVGKTGLARGMGRVGEYVSRPWYVDDWLWQSRQKAAASTVIPGVSNATAAVAAGGTLAAGAGIYLLGRYMKWW